jgi:hypothetical protein
MAMRNILFRNWVIAPDFAMNIQMSRSLRFGTTAIPNIVRGREVLINEF